MSDELAVGIVLTSLLAYAVAVAVAWPWLRVRLARRSARPAAKPERGKVI